MADIILLAKIRSIFSAAANRVNLVSGEDLEVSLGKISKWLSDLKTVAFTGSYNDLTNKPTIPDISTKVSKSGDTMTGTLQFKDGNGNVVGDIQGSTDDTLTIHGGETVDGILELDGILIELLCSLTEVSGELQLDSVYLPSTSDNDDWNILGRVSHSDDTDRIGRVVKLYKSDIVTLASVIAALGYTPVSGVKGNTETDYRTGNVNITAANIGAVRYDTSSQGLTSTQKSNARTNLGLGSAATYSSSSFATSTQGSYATNFNSNFKPIFTTSGQSHSSVFRGKYLGSSFTSAQKTAIANGTFDDLYVGDYWTIGGVNWRIADIDYYMHHGDTECTTHHIVIVPDSSLTTSSMNRSNDTSTGYYGSYMFQTTLGLGTSGTVYTQIANAFGSDFLLSHRELLCNAVSNGNPSGWVWHSTKISIMNQAQIIGQKMWMGGTQDARNLGISDSQFQLFKIAHQFIPSSPRGSFWLRDIISINDFVYIINNGTPYNGGGATASLGVRPYFCLKGA